MPRSQKPEIRAAVADTVADDAGMASLPVDTELSVKLAFDLLPNGDQLDVDRTELVSTVAVDDGGGGGENDARWVQASVVGSQVRCMPAKREANAVAVAAVARKLASDNDAKLTHLLRFPDGSERWVDLSSHPFIAHPPRGNSSEIAKAPKISSRQQECEALRNVIAVHCGRLPSIREPVASDVKLGKGSEQRQMLQQFVRATSADAVAEVVAEHLPKLDSVNVATALYRIARLAPTNARKDFSTAVWECVRLCVDRVRADALAGYSAQASANICWALAKLGLQTSGCAKKDSGDDHRVNKDSSPAALSFSVTDVFDMSALKALSEIRWAACSDWAEVSKWTADWQKSGIWGGWKPQELANVALAISKAGSGRTSELERRFLGVLAQGAVISRWCGFSPQEMANVMTALSTTVLLPAFLVERVLAKMVRNVGMFKPQELCLLLLSAVRAGVPRPSIRPGLRAVFATVVQTQLSGFNSIDQANLMSVLGSTQDREVARKNITREERAAVEETAAASEPFVRLVVSSARRNLAQWRPVEMATLVRSLSRLGLQDTALLRKVCDRWQQLLDGSLDGSGDCRSRSSGAADACAAQPQLLSSLAMALAQLGYADLSLLGRICKLATAGLRGSSRGSVEGSWGAQEATNVLWAAAVMLAFESYDQEEGATTSSVESLPKPPTADLARAVQKLMRAIWSTQSKGLCDLGASNKFTASLHVARQVLCAFAHARTSHGEAATAGEAFEIWEPPPEVAEAWLEAFHSLSGKSNAEMLSARSKMHKDVGETLSSGVLAAVFPRGCRERHEVDVEGVSLDIMLMPKCDEGAEHKVERMAVEVDGPTHFVTPLCIADEAAVASQISTATPCMNGMTKMKRWLMKHVAGMEVVSVRFDDWEACGVDANLRQDLLVRLLREALKRAEVKSKCDSPSSQNISRKRTRSATKGTVTDGGLAVSEEAVVTKVEVASAVGGPAADAVRSRLLFLVKEVRAAAQSEDLCEKDASKLTKYLKAWLAGRAAGVGTNADVCVATATGSAKKRARAS
eukprot:TRINITY_DN39878_c0_g1_i1.p1 TRINITY_DN39878_c0_g1~~TRINITY_DN39878_c0_g1_i1.p1  ORF type:complete len:1033 (+),score=187.23 TRINITY_DN39878_c0_g1_i1:139-3237(+)